MRVSAHQHDTKDPTKQLKSERPPVGRCGRPGAPTPGQAQPPAMAAKAPYQADVQAKLAAGCWHCSVCSLVNDANATTCAVCQQGSRPVSAAQPPEPPPPAAPGGAAAKLAQQYSVQSALKVRRRRCMGATHVVPRFAAPASAAPSCRMALLLFTRLTPKSPRHVFYEPF